MPTAPCSPGTTRHIQTYYADGGWTPEPRDIREPDRPPSSWRSGPWLVRDGAADTVRAHGIYARPYPFTARAGRAQVHTEWVAAYDGWPMFRWAGPRMNWTHRMVSPWNPILAQRLCFDGAEIHCGWPDPDQWGVEAMLAGLKPAGYGSVPDEASYAVEGQLVAAGFDLQITRAPRWVRWLMPRRGLYRAVFAARSGTLVQLYTPAGLDALVADYDRVLGHHGMSPADRIGEVHVLYGYADRPMRELLDDLDSLPITVCGLVLGYPVEVTAGAILHGFHHGYDPRGRACVHDYAELGSMCGPTVAAVER